MITLNNSPIQARKIICVGRNFVKHIEELNNEFPQEMVLFQKSASTASDFLMHPMQSCRFEAEICLLIKDKKVYAVAAGLDLTLDIVQDELKKKGLPWERAKSFKDSSLFTDFKFVNKNSKLSVILFKNENFQQHGLEELMIYPIEEILNQCEEVFGLEDNDIIMTGTPEGVDNFTPLDTLHLQLFADEELISENSWLAAI